MTEKQRAAGHHEWRCLGCNVTVSTPDDVPPVARYCTPCARKAIYALVTSEELAELRGPLRFQSPRAIDSPG